MSWKLSINSKLYNIKDLITDYKSGNHNGIIKQSKGRANMLSIPIQGDIVFVSCNKQKIMKCKVITNFIEYGNGEKDDKYNIGCYRNHATNNTYLYMEILEIYDNPETLKGNQRTWCKYK